MTTTLRFTKGHGTENDFVLLADPDGTLDLTAELVRLLADRRAGIGGDGVIRVVRTAAAVIDAPADAPEWFMDYRNADGSIAEMCGNGVRVFAAFLQREGLAPAESFPIWTRAGQRHVELLETPADGGTTWSVRVGMGPARIRVGEERALQIGDLRMQGIDVDMGNPHTVAQLPEDGDLRSLQALDLTRRPLILPDPEHGINMEFVVPVGERHVAMRVFERGVGETRSCGTGVAAAAVASAVRAGDDSGRPWTVDVPGGRLLVGWDGDQVTLTGPAALVAHGTVTL